jgi:hypothetical protein
MMFRCLRRDNARGMRRDGIRKAFFFNRPLDLAHFIIGCFTI